MNMIAEQYFQIRRADTAIANQTDLARRAFAGQRALLCRSAISEELLAGFAKAALSVNFSANIVDGLGHRWIERPHLIGAAIELSINRPALRDWLSVVTGQPRIGAAEGRLVETRAGGVDQLTWHDDQMANACLGVTVHLRPCGYEGGAFELREKNKEQNLFQHASAMQGDIVFFDVSPQCEHRVLPISSGEARRVFTGWYFYQD